MLSTSGAHHVAVLVDDVEAVARFYAEVLCLRLLRRHPDEHGGLRSVWLSLGADCFLAVERATERPTRPAGGPGWHMIAVRIRAEDRAAWRARLAEAGAPLHKETDFTLYTRDPEGNEVGLSHYPTPAHPG